MCSVAPQSLPSITLSSVMPEKELRWLWKAFRFRLSKQEKSEQKDDGNRQDGQFTPPVVPPTPSKSAAGSITDAGISQTAKTEPVPSAVGLQSNLPASSVQEPTTPSAEYPSPAAATNSPAREATSAPKETAITTPPEQLWDQAYDGLKHDEPKLFELYETILSRDLDSSEGVKGNVIEQNRTKRRSQMDCLLDTGLDKTARLVHVEKNISDAIKIVLSVKEAVGSALQAVPIAAVAWTGVCVALQVFLNPVDEMTTNRDGIMQVVRTMKWYSSLSKLLLEEPSEHDEHFVELRGLLANRILDLYKALLKYIIKSICAYYRHPALEFLRNSVRLNNWTGSLDDVNKAEDSVKAAASDYGVRQANSYLGLLVNMHVSKAQDEIMQKLCVTDMTAEIESLQERKDHLLADSYKWILDNKDYQDFADWHHDNMKRLLWIKGDAGKGKTMLLIGMVGELTAQLETHFDKSYLSYFFCQGTNDKLNTATAILRGLIWMLLRQQKSLIRHLDIFKDLGSTLFEARIAFYNLKKVLQSMLEDKILERAYLVIDALDECRREEPGLPQLLELISEMSGKNGKVKWLVSSRNEPEIETVLEEHTARTRLSLELNAESVAGAVDSYIDCKMSELAERHRKAYAVRNVPKIHEKLQRVQDDVAKELRQRADGTFLWVALVFKQIEGCGADKVLERVQQMPSGLYSMYAQMMRYVNELDDAADCKRVLLTVVNTYRPLHLSELATLAELSDLAVHQDVVRHCGLLTIKEDDDVVYFVHQSAKDYLIQDPNSDIISKIFPGGYAEGHHTIVSRSLESMTQNLRRDIYDLQHPGCSIDEVKSLDPDPLASVRYACVYWIDHLCDMESGHNGVGLCDNGIIDVFLKKHFLHWLEALSLMKSIPDSVFAIAKLISLLMRVSSESQLLRLVQDMHRFILSSRNVIENTPLQAYSSALLFSPVHSLTRGLFQDEEPDWITTKPAMEADWGACIQTLYGHSDWVSSVAFSHDGTQVVSGSSDKTVKIWDAGSGVCLKTLEGHSDWVNSVAFSHDGTQVVSGSGDKTVKIWDAGSSVCLKTLEGHSYSVRSVAFSHDGTQVVSGSQDKTVKIWDATSTCLKTLEGHSDWVISVTFSHDDTQVVSGSVDETVKIWDASSGACLKTLEGHSDSVWSVAFSHDDTQVVSGSEDKTVKIWDASTGACLKTLEGHSWVWSVAFSHDSTQVLSGSEDMTVKIWDASSGAYLKTLEGHSDRVRSVAFLHDSTQVLSGSDDKTVKIWDASSGAYLKTLEGRSDWICSVAFSHDSTQVVSGSSDKTVKIWDAGSGAYLKTLEGHSDTVWSVVFSHNDTQVLSGSGDKTVKIWDAGSGVCLKTLEGHSDWIWSVAFSHDGTQVVSGSRDETVKIWDASSTCLKTLDGHSYWVISVAFSHDGTQVVSGSRDKTVKIWDASSGGCLKTLEGHSDTVYSVAFSHDGTQVVSGSGDKTVKIWDAGSGACLKTLNIGRTDSVAFDTTGSYLLTDTGTISWDISSDSNTALAATALEEPRHHGYGLNADQAWITWNGQNVLWLPSEYRSSCSAIASSTIVIGCPSGRVLTINFSFNKSPLNCSS